MDRRRQSSYMERNDDETAITQVGRFIYMVHINYGTVRKVNNPGRTVYLHGPY